jgi:adenosylcobyric acid synthase
MLGGAIADPDGTEGAVGQTPGLGWLAVTTTFDAIKTTRLRQATADGAITLGGYEIHHGRTAAGPGWHPWLAPAEGENDGDVLSAASADGVVVGTSLHGLFESDAFRASFLTFVATAAGKRWQPGTQSFEGARQDQINRVADACAAYLDLDALWRLIEVRAPSA